MTPTLNCAAAKRRQLPTAPTSNGADFRKARRARTPTKALTDDTLPCNSSDRSAIPFVERITTTVRLWQRPHVKVGGRYALPPGEVVVTRILEVALADVTPELARASGFAGLVDLLKVAKHGPGRRVFVIDFRYQAKR